MKITTNARAEHVMSILQHVIDHGVNSIEIGSPSNGPANLRGYWHNKVTPGVANTEFTVVHNLGYIPTGMHIIAIDQAAIIYVSRKAQWTPKVAYFKCNQASVNLQGFVV